MCTIGRVFGVLALASAAALLPACSKSDSGGASSGGSGGKPYVAFISNNPYEFWVIAKKGTEAAAKEFDVRVDFMMPQDNNSATQRRIIEDLQNKGVQAIAISPNDSANQVDFFKGINAKLPLLAVDNDIPDPSARRCYIGTDNVTAGKAVGKLIKQHVPAGGKFMIFVGQLDAQNAQERRLGVVTELAGGADKAVAEIAKLNRNEYPIKFGDYVLLGTMTDNADATICRQKAEDTLTKYPDVKCLVGLWEYNPPAILKAVQSQNKVGQVIQIGFDENEETLKGIKDGAIAGTVVQDPYNFGYESVRIMAGIVRGDDKALQRPDINKDKQIYIKHRIINKDGKALPAFQDEKVEAVEAFHTRLKELKGN